MSVTALTSRAGLQTSSALSCLLIGDQSETDKSIHYVPGEKTHPLKNRNQDNSC